MSVVISVLALAVTALPVQAQASDVDALVTTFEQGCFTSQESTQDNWYPIATDFDPSLKSYYGTIDSLLGEQIVSEAHFAIFDKGSLMFLTRYQYVGQFGLSSQVCMVSDFARDSWEFPAGLEAFLADKIEDTDHSVNVIENEKSVGHWRAADSQKPITKITASAFPKDGEHHEASQFYGVQLTATRLNSAEINTIN